MKEKHFKADMIKLYAVTDRTWTGTQTLEEQVREALEGGATLIQLREKALDDEAFFEEAVKMKAVTDAYHVPLIINDNIDVCIKSGAAGVHVGQSDMTAGRVRALLGPEKIIGVTAKTPEQAKAAYENGADYIGCGAVFGSKTKLDTSAISLEQLDTVCQSVPIPVVAIGGINAENINQLAEHDMDGVAVVSAIFAQKDIKTATKDLLDKVEKLNIKNKIVMEAYKEEDIPQMVSLWNDVVEDGVAFPQTDKLTLQTGKEFFESQTYNGVARNINTGKIEGLYILHPNNVGRCGHICNASFAVRKDVRGLHIGEKLVKNCLEEAKKHGFKVMQFNAVVATNTHARHLYERIGFKQLGVIPKGFLMKDGHYEDICPYYYEL